MESVHWNVYFGIAYYLSINVQIPLWFFKNKYYNKSKLLFTETDILIYETKTENVYEGFSSDKEMLHFSNYSTKSKYYHNSNKLVLGKMRDEAGVVIIREIIGLKPKMYLFLVENSEPN